ncbi:MUC3B protein, partial [Herpetotheres cachinnans]|nr:MUC3B protein [Herpetotheres cachinnans]
DPCLNGGHWTGIDCLCPPNIEGPRCQFGVPTINITAELGFSVTMEARVINRNFSEDMGDTSSTAYRGFVDEFSRTMDRIYHNVSGYRGTRVLTLARGSVVVNYKVLLHPPARTTSLDHRARELLEAANAAAQPHNCSHLAGRCQATHGRSGLGSPHWCFSSPELCRKYTPARFSRYYYPRWMGNSLFCISNCSLNVPSSISCNNG